MIAVRVAGPQKESSGAPELFAKTVHRAKPRISSATPVFNIARAAEGADFIQVDIRAGRAVAADARGTAGSGTMIPELVVRAAAMGWGLPIRSKAWRSR